MRDSSQVIQKAADQIKNGYPMVIFPEGTRSRSSIIKNFKNGSLKLAIRSNASIVLLTVNRTYRILEEKRGGIAPALFQLTIHKPVDCSLLADSNTQKLALYLHEIIQQGLEHANS
ncbi:MAG: 1-acyl-sn-glycerol-3-phosphate acyltransferase [Chitinivibrionales bacterium]|nr:1-acyl-sn-glycerol-3-phosphate acyltransferase [Chitinivibrionales bacterium]